MWFKKLTGFSESSAQKVRKNITVDSSTLHSKVNNRTLRCGTLEIPDLAELRRQALKAQKKFAPVSVRELIADVQSLHIDTANTDALFQVASQFNLLEMVSPSATPERGVDIYESDYTQGPACAVAAGAGTIYRNYFVPVSGQPGQTENNQIDCLKDIGTALGNNKGTKPLWKMTNGYALATESGLLNISKQLASLTEAKIDKLREKLRIGIQWDTQVTLADCTHTVSQAYCSALPVAYSEHSADLWEKFSRLVLEATYEATFCAAVINYSKTGNNRLYLTLIGGGAFGNNPQWIIQAIKRSLNIYKNSDLDIIIVSHSEANAPVQQLIKEFTLKPRKIS